MAKLPRIRKNQTVQFRSPAGRIPLFVCGGSLLAILFLVALTMRGKVYRDSTVSRSPPSTKSHSLDPDSPLVDQLSLPLESRPTWTELDNPATDGWQSEVISRQVEQQLKELGDMIIAREKIAKSLPSTLVSDDYEHRPFVPESLHTVFQGDLLRVERLLKRSATIKPRTSVVEVESDDSGLAQFSASVISLKQRFRDAVDLRYKFKVFRVDAPGSSPQTRQYFSLSGSTILGFVEQNAIWDIQWIYDDPQNLPRIKKIELIEFEQVTRQVEALACFSDCTESVLAGNHDFRRQFLRGMNHWLERTQETRYFAALGNPGLSVGDVNGDGLDDLYVCQEGGLPNRLFLQKPDGTAQDVSQDWGVDWLQATRSALLIDLDNDGDQDLVIATVGNLVLAANDRHHRFEIREVLPTADDTMALSAVDYDNDGDLDIYVTVNYPNDSPQDARDASIAAGATNSVYHDANNAGPNSLFQNNISTEGNWVFTDVTREVGLDVNNRRFSQAASWDDLDNDGDQDLYVANDFGRNNLFRNELSERGKAKFVDIASTAHAEDSASGMSVSWGDYDRDGHMDLYVANMFSAAGSRITFQEQFKPKASEQTRTRLQRFARGNTLLHNLGGGQFSDQSVAANVTMGRWAWGTNFVDINNDGWEDIVIANGYITADNSGDL